MSKIMPQIFTLPTFAVVVQKYFFQKVIKIFLTLYTSMRYCE